MRSSTLAAPQTLAVPGIPQGGPCVSALNCIHNMFI